MAIDFTSFFKVLKTNTQTKGQTYLIFDLELKIPHFTELERDQDGTPGGNQAGSGIAACKQQFIFTTWGSYIRNWENAGRGCGQSQAEVGLQVFSKPSIIEELSHLSPPHAYA